MAFSASGLVAGAAARAGMAAAGTAMKNTFGSGALGEINKSTALNNAWSAQQASELRDWQVQQNEKAMQFNAEEAAKNRNWQEMMSNTAHQREVKDLQAAGLNPVLSAMNGNGASVGSGATASGVTSAGDKGDTDTSRNSAIASILATVYNARNQMDMANMNAQTNLALADKYTAMSKLVAEINQATTLGAAGISASATRDAAAMSSSAARYASDNARAASQYASDISRDVQLRVATIQREVSAANSQRSTGASRYNTQTMAKVNTYASNVQAAAQRYSVDATNANKLELQKAQQEFERYCKQTFPSNIYQAVFGTQDKIWQGILGG